MKQVSVRPNKLFSLTPIDDVTSTNELHSKPACYIHGLTHACNLFKARTRNCGMERGETVVCVRRGVSVVCLNISVLPSPAERNCVIMPDSFYYSNQGYCLCKRPAPLCAAEQPRHYYTGCRKWVQHHRLRRCRLKEQGCNADCAWATGITGMPAPTPTM